MHLLLIEDNRADVFMINTILHELPEEYTLIVKKDGLEAIKYITESFIQGECTLPDIIILDLNLPVISGMDVLKFVKSNKNLNRVPVVIFSSSVYNIDRVNSLQAGATDFFIKPFDLDEYIKVIRKIITEIALRKPQSEEVLFPV